jgi:hypothetical protein
MKESIERTSANLKKTIWRYIIECT